VEHAVPRPLGPKRVSRSIPAIQVPRADLDDEEALKAQLLADVVAHAHRETRAVMMAKAIESFKSRPFIVAFIALIMLVITAYSYTSRAEWVFGAPVAASEQRESHLRFAMFLAMQRLVAYREANQGALPANLIEVQEDWPGVTYRVIGDTLIELSAQDNKGEPMMLRSDRDARAFVGLSPTALRRNIPGSGGAP
jgi:hypothetical protein